MNETTEYVTPVGTDVRADGTPIAGVCQYCSEPYDDRVCGFDCPCQNNGHAERR